MSPLRRSPAARGVDAVAVAVKIGGVLLMANVSALVDSFLHPEIPYLDPEHLVVGGIAAFVCAGLLAALALRRRALAAAEERIVRLEAVMSICMYCKKVRTPSSSKESLKSWQSVESFVLRRFHMRFSHGMCPECENRAYAPSDAG